ncbi:uncharacterized protein VP01_241g4 [Puccinia sorghi]|uniref:Uncharacterized protein n=1 Tax=Puccinia sorghi TaxID=27349 RepID=A0A0L6V6G6_9BASI|nr:uncharacterized protein VP01_241g4 [Puccinia sorghi]
MFSHTRPQSTPSAALNTTQLSVRSHKQSRKPGFRVFCDDEQESSVGQPGRHSHSRTRKSTNCPPAVVNNKENQVLELNNRTISNPSKTTRRRSPTRVLGEKPLASSSARVNCVDKWGSAIPFTTCEFLPSSSKKLAHLEKEEPTKPEKPSQIINTNTKKSKTDALPKRLASHVYNRAADNERHPQRQVVDDEEGLKELVTKLEALQAIRVNLEDTEEALAIQEPLPATATCPGAPKMPSVFTMPLFVADDDVHCDDAQTLDFFANKSPNSLQMSPLAEVTEAFTGLQGGWSPPTIDHARFPTLLHYHPISMPADLS